MDKPEKLSRIGKRIKELRTERKLNLATVAQKADITAGLLSRIENFRTIPSLPVLNAIADALEVSMSDLVKNVSTGKSEAYILIRGEELEEEPREDSRGLSYFPVINEPIQGINLSTYIVRIPANTLRPAISTEATEFLHMISGEVLYGIDQETIHLKAGDCLFFDGNIPHSVQNDTDTEAVMIKNYYFKDKS